MAASESPNQRSRLASPEVWTELETEESTVEPINLIEDEEPNTKVSNHIDYVGYDWFSAQDLTNYIDNYMEEMGESDFRRVYHLEGNELLEEMRDAAETIDNLLTETIDNIGQSKEKAEEKAIKTIKKYDQIKQTLSKMQAGEENDYRVVRDEPYHEILQIDNNLQRGLIRHIDNLEHEYDLNIRDSMANYQKNPNFNPDMM